MSGWVAGAAVVGAVGGSLISSNAAKQAAKTQAGAAHDATSISHDEYLQTREDNAPWRAAGQNALAQLSDLTKSGGDLTRRFTIDDFIKDPGYDFRMSEGAKAIERSAAARGGALSGATLKALTQYNQNFASNEFNNAYSRWNADNTNIYNRLAGIAGVGQAANAANQQAGQVYSTNASNNLMGAANASGAAQIASANQISNALNTGVNAFAYYAGKKA